MSLFTSKDPPQSVKSASFEDGFSELFGLPPGIVSSIYILLLRWFLIHSEYFIFPVLSGKPASILQSAIWEESDEELATSYGNVR